MQNDGFSAREQHDVNVRLNGFSNLPTNYAFKQEKSTVNEGKPTKSPTSGKNTDTCYQKCWKLILSTFKAVPWNKNTDSKLKKKDNNVSKTSSPEKNNLNAETHQIKGGRVFNCDLQNKNERCFNFEGLKKTVQECKENKEPEKERLKFVKKTQSLSNLTCLGFPNLGVTCYMNAALQGLLSLKPFVEEIHCQEKVWRVDPVSTIFKGFKDVFLSRFHNNFREKCRVMDAFKNIISQFNAEFHNGEYDTQEFLMAILESMTMESVKMMVKAERLGVPYICPVKAHIAFQMVNVRTCENCNSTSSNFEDSMTLHLNVLDKAPLSRCLEDYLKSHAVECSCNCGSQNSNMKVLFNTTPTVLMIKLKRFMLTPGYRLFIDKRPVHLSKKLNIPNDCTLREKETTTYSLVSVISHKDNFTAFGHSVCDAAYSLEDPGDQWLTYDDNLVSLTTWQTVCSRRQKDAYMLFYVKDKIHNDSNPQTKEKHVPHPKAEAEPKSSFTKSDVASPSDQVENKNKVKIGEEAESRKLKTNISSSPEKYHLNADMPNMEGGMVFNCGLGNQKERCFTFQGLKKMAQECEENKELVEHTKLVKKKFSPLEFTCLGFPNLDVTCYMNAALQGLLSLQPFVEEIYCQEKVWSIDPVSPIFKGLKDVILSRFHNNFREQCGVMGAFKNIIDQFDAEFHNRNYDTHKFLMAILESIKMESMKVMVKAESLGVAYICPVKAHIAFQMVNVRTCENCKFTSSNFEDSMTLHLNVQGKVPLSRCLDDYLKSHAVKCSCSCGSQNSNIQVLFNTTPTVLMIKLKRFMLTPCYRLAMDKRPIYLSKKLNIPKYCTLREKETTTYSLVSVISHEGNFIDCNHNVCHVTYKLQDPGDQWLTYNDNLVSVTTWQSVCARRQKDAYILFYVKDKSHNDSNRQTKEKHVPKLEAEAEPKSRFTKSDVASTSDQVENKNKVKIGEKAESRTLKTNISSSPEKYDLNADMPNMEGGMVFNCGLGNQKEKCFNIESLKKIAQECKENKEPEKKPLKHLKKTFSPSELTCPGFPNLGVTCYMNAALQGLLSLQPFLEEIHCQEKVWRVDPVSAIFKGFNDIILSRFHNNFREKCRVMDAFKNIIGQFNAEFHNGENDTQEFLMAILESMTMESVKMMVKAESLGVPYICPVKAHIAFQMVNIRTCEVCKSTSTNFEDSMTLHLNVQDNEPLSRCLDDYLRSHAVECSCSCGSQNSSMNVLFNTTPTVLMIQLKRFKLTPHFELVVDKRPFCLSNKLNIPKDNTLREKETTTYTLVSVISHKGNFINFGHYVCDAACRPEDPGNQWLTYDDDLVSVTTWQSVCASRQKDAYVLFYVKDKSHDDSTPQTKGKRILKRETEAEPKSSVTNSDVASTSDQVEKKKISKERR